MANPGFSFLTNPHFFRSLLPGFHRHHTIPAAFFLEHIEGRNKNKTAKLRSDVSFRTWELEMVGRSFTGGWEDFAFDHDLRVGDILLFRYEGDMVFHVTAFGPGCYNTEHASSPSHDEDDDDDYDDKEDDDEESDEETIYTSNRSREKRVKKNPKSEAEFSLDRSCFVARATDSNLRIDVLTLPKAFAQSNGLEGRQCDIVLKDEEGRSWTLILGHREPSGQVFMRRGWRGFCHANGLNAGNFVTLKLVQNGATPVLQLSGTYSSNSSSVEECSKENDKRKTKAKKTPLIWKCSTSPRQIQFVILTLKPYSLVEGRLLFQKPFTRANDIEKSGKTTLVDKHGAEWPIHLWKHWKEQRQGKIAFGKGLKSFCEANGLKEGESSMLELIWRDSGPVLKFCSKIQLAKPEDSDAESQELETLATAHQPEETQRQEMDADKSKIETETQTHKRVLVQGPNLHPAWEKQSKHQEAAESSRHAQSFDISNPLAQAKQRIADILTAVRQFRQELKTKEQNLEASLRELEALGQET